MKKTMKKTLFTTMLAVILVCTLMMSAFASNFEHLADELKGLGLFRGTETGYELEREPNRAEALVMLLRLLGLEEEALASEYEHPFADVPAWVAPYVSYAYENGMTTGMTETEFGPSVNCSAQMFVTFVLRSLGYDDQAGDFTYAGALSFGKGVGIIDDFIDKGTFLRDNMVAVAFLALNVEPKDGGFDTLLEKLVDDGAVEESDAKLVFEFFVLYDEVMKIKSQTDDETNVALQIKIDADMGESGSIKSVVDASRIVDDDGIIAKISTTSTTNGQEDKEDSYLMGGYTYMEVEGKKIKMDSELTATYLDNIFMLSEIGEIISRPIYSFINISKTTEGDLSVYSIERAESVYKTEMNQTLDFIGDIENEAAVIDKIIGYKIFVDADGVTQKIELEYEMTLSTETEEEGAVSVLASVKMEINIVAVGDSVSVELPDDLDNYELVENNSESETDE